MTPDSQSDRPTADAETDSPPIDQTGHVAPPIVPEGEHNDLGEPERPEEHGRIGYGRLGRYTPFLLALGIIVVLFAIGYSQTRSGDDGEPTIAPPETPQVGDPAPTVALTLFDGTTLDLAALRGSIVFVNFWASWCDPCLEEIPDLITLDGGTTADGVPIRVVGVGVRADDEADARQMAADLGIDYPVGRDTGGGEGTRGPIQVALDTADYSMPSTVVIDPVGTIAAVYYGPRDLDIMSEYAEDAAG